LNLAKGIFFNYFKWFKCQFYWKCCIHLSSKP